MSIGSWDNYRRENTTATPDGGDWPDVPEDLYDATVLSVSDPVAALYEGRERTSFYMTFEFDVPATDDQEAFTSDNLRFYVGLPAGYIDNGFISEKSTLYKVLNALNLPIEGGVDPRDWVGMSCRVMTGHKAMDDGTMRPRITDVKPARRPTPKPAEKRQPVGAGGLRARLQGDD